MHFTKKKKNDEEYEKEQGQQFSANNYSSYMLCFEVRVRYNHEKMIEK